MQVSKADKHQLQTTDIFQTPFAKVSVDLIMELLVTHPGNKNIVVMVHHLSDWSSAKAFPDKEASTVADAIYRLPPYFKQFSKGIKLDFQTANLVRIPKFMYTSFCIWKSFDLKNLSIHI